MWVKRCVKIYVYYLNNEKRYLKSLTKHSLRLRRFVEHKNKKEDEMQKKEKMKRVV